MIEKAIPQAVESEEKPLPSFRKDIVIYPGPVEEDGSPTYNLYDPVRAQFFRITWAESLVFKHFKRGMKASQLIVELERETTLKASEQDILLFFQDALSNNLLDLPKSSEKLMEEAALLRVGWFKWFIYHYLYIRVPLFNPDDFLTRTMEYVRPLFSAPAYFIYISLFVLGMVQLLQRFDEFLHTFTYFFSFEGAIIYALGITFVKVIHELSHAYIAKYYGLYVPAIGAAFIVFWPVLYTDVTDSWKLAKRSQRLAISFAGIAAELTLAGLSTLGWALSPPGLWQSVFFVIASVTWISTLVVNLNPALRFDGYYLLSDLWGIDNLQPRTFAFTRWQLRKWLLGVDLAPPEEFHSTSRKMWIMVYAVFVWIYRLFLYTAIAIFIYLKFTKLLGIFLFILEIGVFILWPIAWEIEHLYKIKEHLTWNKRSILTLTFLTIFLLWFILPLPHNLSFPAITDPKENQILYVPYDAEIKKINVGRGSLVQKGEVLVELFSSGLKKEINAAELERDLYQQEVIIASQNEQDRPIIAQKEAETSAIEAKLAGLKKQERELTMIATVTGSVYAWDETLHIDQSVAKDQVLGKVADINNLEIFAFIPEINANDLFEGQEVIFRVKSTLKWERGVIEKIKPERTRTLQYPQLASTHGGPLAVVQDPSGKDLLLVDSHYIAMIKPEHKEQLMIGEIGEIEVRGPWRSYLMRVVQYLRSLIYREVSP